MGAGHAVAPPRARTRAARRRGTPAARTAQRAGCERQAQKADVLVLTNGPGEVCSWVRAAAEAIARSKQASATRVFAALAPCPHASGREVQALAANDHVADVAGPRQFP